MAATINPIKQRLDAHASQGRTIIEAICRNMLEIYYNSRNNLNSKLVEFVKSNRTSLTGPRLVQLSEEIQAMFGGLEEQYRGMVKDYVPWLAQGYYNAALNDLNIYGNTTAVGSISPKRLQAMIDDDYRHIAGATKNMSDTAILNLRRLSARVMREAAMTGATRAEVSKRLLGANTASGLFKFIDKGGREWDNATYFDMLGRTMLHNNARTAYLDGCADNGSDVVKVSVSGNPCPACAQWENRLLSITGRTPGLPTLTEAISSGLFHPNCTHRVSAVPDAIRERKYDASGRALSGLNSAGNEVKNDHEAWKKYRQESAQKNKKRVPAGTPVGDALRIATSNADGKAVIKYAIDAIAKVHGDGELPEIPVHYLKMEPGNYGAFISYARGDAIKINISSKGPYQQLSTLHEIGHFLDHSGLTGPGNQFGSENNPLLDNLRTVLNNSDSVKSIKSSTGISDKSRKYYLDQTEIFARAYSQYIVTKSKDPLLTQQLGKIIDKYADSSYNIQWNENDFKPIAHALDELFLKKGWIK